jgi:hypothetical protein
LKNLFLLQPIDLSPGDLLYYGGVEWLNISDFLGKIKKVGDKIGGWPCQPCQKIRTLFSIFKIGEQTF